MLLASSITLSNAKAQDNQEGWLNCELHILVVWTLQL